MITKRDEKNRKNKNEFHFFMRLLKKSTHFKVNKQKNDNKMIIII